MRYVPPRSPKCYLPRPRLFEELDRGADVPLTTVVGPPGCGKTVAVASWVADRPKTPTVWMSCDERDADPVTFWAGAVLEACRPKTHRQRLDTAVLRTRARFALGDDAAGDSLAECVDLARTEGFVVALTDALPGLGTRLSFQLRSVPLGDFEEAVLDRLDRPPASVAAGGAVDLVEHLTAREHVILRYLDSRLTVTDIAAECFVSRNTLKTHIRAIYRKLGVSSRPEAIGEGRRLRLL